MQQLKKQSCPLCGNATQFELRDHLTRKHFWCNNCGEFQISLDAENILAFSIPEWRSQNSEEAKKSNESYVWVITRSNAPKQEGLANVMLNGEYVLRSELPL